MTKATEKIIAKKLLKLEPEIKDLIGAGIKRLVMVMNLLESGDVFLNMARKLEDILIPKVQDILEKEFLPIFSNLAKKLSQKEFEIAIKKDEEMLNDFLQEMKAYYAEIIDYTIKTHNEIQLDRMTDEQTTH